jgi:hypothetical protein
MQRHHLLLSTPVSREANIVTRISTFCVVISAFAVLVLSANAASAATITVHPVTPKPIIKTPKAGSHKTILVGPSHPLTTPIDSATGGATGNSAGGSKGSSKGGSKGGSKGSTDVVGYRNGGDPVLLKRLPGH